MYQEEFIGYLIHHQLVFSLKQISASFILPFNINIPKHSHIENLDASKYNCQSLDLSCDKICVGGLIFYHLKDDGKIYPYYIVKIRYPFIYNTSSVLFI